MEDSRGPENSVAQAAGRATGPPPPPQARPEGAALAKPGAASAPASAASAPDTGAASAGKSAAEHENPSVPPSGPPGAPNSARVASALRVKVSKLERLCTLTKKKLEDVQRHAAAVEAQLARERAAAETSRRSAAAAEAEKKRTAVTAETLRGDVARGLLPQILQRVIVDLGPAPRGDDDDVGALTPAGDTGRGGFGGEEDGLPPHVKQGWCCVARQRMGVPTECIDPDGVAWLRESDLAAVLPSVTDTPPALPASEAVALTERCGRLQHQLDVLQDRHRDYRIRTEAQLRQKEDQVADATRKAAALQQRRITGHDLSVQLESAKRQILSLTRSYEELQALEVTRKKGVRSLKKDVRTALQQADTWRRRYEEAVREAERVREGTPSRGGSGTGGAGGSASGATPGAGAGAAAGGSGAEGAGAGGAGGGAGRAGDWSDGGGDEDDAMKQLAEVTAEYGVYRKRALEIITKKDQEIQQLHMALRRRASSNSLVSPSVIGAGGGLGGSSGVGAMGREGGTSSVGSETAESHARAGRDDATNEYLKNVLLRYMLSSDDTVRGQLETAIAAVVGFSPVEVRRIRAARTEQAAAGSLWSKATSLFGQ